MPWADLDAGAAVDWATRGRTHSPSAGLKPEARVPASLPAVASSRQLDAREMRRRGRRRRAGSAEHDRIRLIPTTGMPLAAGAGRIMPFALDLTTEH